MSKPRKPSNGADPPFNIREVALQAFLEFRNADGKLQRRQPAQVIVVYEAEPAFALALDILKSKGLIPIEDPDAGADS